MSEFDSSCPEAVPAYALITVNAEGDLVVRVVAEDDDTVIFDRFVATADLRAVEALLVEHGCIVGRSVCRWDDEEAGIVRYEVMIDSSAED